MNIKTTAKKIAGVLLIIFGVAGLFLPILQGIFMIIAGAALLGNQKLIKWIKQLGARLESPRRKKR